MRLFIVLLNLVFVCAFVSPASSASKTEADIESAPTGDYDFDLDAELDGLSADNADSEQGLKHLIFNAEAALSENIVLLRKSSRLFKQRYYDNSDQEFATEFDANLKLMAEYKKELLTSYARLDFEGTKKAADAAAFRFRLSGSYFLG
jgi:hypothetical protein